jgi:hypothetical protein
MYISNDCRPDPLTEIMEHVLCHDFYQIITAKSSTVTQLPLIEITQPLLDK